MSDCSEEQGPEAGESGVVPDLAEGADLSDVWDIDTVARVGALNGWTLEDLYTMSTFELEGYFGFRVGFAEDGRWLFALAGD